MITSIFVFRSFKLAKSIAHKIFNVYNVSLSTSSFDTILIHCTYIQIPSQSTPGCSRVRTEGYIRLGIP